MISLGKSRQVCWALWGARADKMQPIRMQSRLGRRRPTQVFINKLMSLEMCCADPK